MEIKLYNAFYRVFNVYSLYKYDANIFKRVLN